jgi:hypothetical protein
MNYFAGRSSSAVMDVPRRAYTPAAAPPPSDFSRFITEGMLSPVLEGFNTAAANMRDSMSGLSQKNYAGTGTMQERGRKRQKDCGCREDCDCDCDCEREDSCHCNCCIVDADLVVYARLGETRVIPFTIENKWRRERKIKLELGEWRRRGGVPGPIRAEILPPAPEFELPPCGHKKLTMIVRIGELPGEREFFDVDDCTVYYADLFVHGCDIRPLRIALAVLPRDCRSWEIECRCGCC